MSRKPDIHRVLSRYADLNPPLGYPGGSCYLQDRIRSRVPIRRMQEEIIDRHLSGEDQDPNQQVEEAIYNVIDEGPIPRTSFRQVLLSEHAQYRMDQKEVNVSHLRKAFREFQKYWSKEVSRGFGPLIRKMQQRDEFEFVSRDAGISVVMRPLQLWSPGQKLDVWVRTVFPSRGKSEPVPPEQCEYFVGWSRDYPEHGLDRLFPKRADLSPPLGSAGRVARKYALKMAPIPGVQTLVNDKSQKGLPTNIDREKETNLPPGSATPGGAGRDIGSFSYSGPDSESDIKPRTLGIPGEEYGHPSNNTYNTVTRRTMTSGGLTMIPDYGSSDAALPRGEPVTVSAGMRRRMAKAIAFHGWGMDAQDMRMPGPEFTDKRPIPPEDVEDAISYLEEVRPGVLVAYSRGGAVAMLALRESGSSPKVIWVAPAWRRGWAKVAPPPGAKGVVIHGDKDNSVPLQHSCDLANQTGMPLRVVPDRSHVSILKDKTNPGAGVGVPPDKIRECVDTMPDWGAGSGKGTTEDIEAQREFVRSLMASDEDEDAEGMDKEAYQRRWQRGKRQRRSRGSDRRKRQRSYRKNRQKRKMQSRRWRRKNKNKSSFKRSEKRRRSQNRKRRVASVLTVPDIAFTIGPEELLGYVHSISPLSGMVTIELDETNVSQLDSLPVEVFLRMAVFLTEQDIDAFYELVDVEIGPGAYADLDEVLVRECAARYDRNPDADDFKAECFDLTDEYELSSMSPDQLESVTTSVIQGFIEEGHARSVEDADDPEIGDEYDPHLFYGEVDVER